MMIGKGLVPNIVICDTYLLIQVIGGANQYTFLVHDLLLRIRPIDRTWTRVVRASSRHSQARWARSQGNMNRGREENGP